jgi:hypothetical protein
MRRYYNRTPNYALSKRHVNLPTIIVHEPYPNEQDIEPFALLFGEVHKHLFENVPTLVEVQQSKALLIQMC